MWLGLAATALAACENPQPPAACGPVPGQTLHAGESASVPICFNDPNGDVLLYTVTSSEPAVATATASGTVVTVTAVSPGSATITVTATDSGGLEATSEFQVVVPNRPPLAAGPIEARTLGAGDTATVDAAAHFTDPDGEALAYTAVSSAPDVVSARASDGEVTIAALSRGAASVEITATDPGGLSASQAFRVTVPNRAPVALDTIPSLTLPAGVRDTVSVAAFFGDPDGDSLAFQAAPAEPAVAAAVVVDSLVVVIGVRRGETDVTVRALDPDGLSASQTLQVTVPNSGPVPVETIPSQELEEGRTKILDVLPYFSDADGDALMYTASTTDAGVAAVGVADNAVVIEGTGIGSTQLTVTARDPEGADAIQQTPITVLPGGLPDLVVSRAWPLSAEVPSNGPGQAVAFTVENVGRAVAETGRARFLGSHDAFVSPPDSVLGEGVLPGSIAPGGAVTLSYTVASSDPGGTRFYAGLCLDEVPGEAAAGNNCSAAVQVSVVPGPATGPGQLVPAYLTQAVQSSDFAVPLLAGEPALLRVFVDGGPTGAATGVPMPPVRAVFHDGENEVHVAEIPLAAGPVPAQASEGDLRSSANATIPGNIVRPGLEMVVQVDPEGLLGPTSGVARRIPALGRLRADVRPVPELALTLVPLVWSEQPDRSVIDVATGADMGPESVELLRAVRDLLPVAGLSITAHDPVITSSNRATELLAEVEAIRVMEGGGGHYMGLMAQFEMYGGLAYRPGRSSVAVPQWGTVAHELGHNISLAHAPCGDPAQVDPAFPYPDGSTGAWGYDFRGAGRLVPPTASDLMSYCFNQRWISDYHFTRALEFRIRDESPAPHAAAPATARSLLLWGGVGPDGSPFLEPAFVVEAPPALPEGAGDYRLTGRSAAGENLFSFTFAMPEVADGDGGSSFAFALPIQPGWEGTLISIALAGPGGWVALDRRSDRRMAVLRDPVTGHVRGFLRDLPPGVPTGADAADEFANAALANAVAGAIAAGVRLGRDLEVLFSRGIPDAVAWRR